METIALILNFLGSLLIAIAFGKYRGDGAPYTGNKDGGKIYIAYLNHPSLFKTGLFLLVAGFGLQAFEKLKDIEISKFINALKQLF